MCLHRIKRRQSGTVLIIGLIMLVIVTMIGLASMQTTTQQERMAGNLGDRNAALQYAEGALREGEAELRTGLANYAVSLTVGRYDVESNPAPDPLTDLWTNNRTNATALSVSYSATQVQPFYRLEKQPNITFSASIEAGSRKDLEVFEVTARSSTVRNDTIVILQSTYTR